MTVAEFLEIRRWLVDHWPTMSSLTSGQWVAYRDELERFDPSDVWAAIHIHFQTGPDFPPGVATLTRLATEQNLQAVRRCALPESHGIPWAEYSQQRWGKVIPLGDVGRLITEGELA